MSHTPGPWEVDPSPYRSAGGGLCVMHGGECVALVGDYNPEQPIMDNARLIATAPELLTALSDLLNLYLQLVNSGDAGNWDPEKDNEVIAARAAINKANP